MTRHFPANRNVKRQKLPWQQQKQQEQQQKERAWYCKKHDVKYLCDICGNDNKHDKEQKYYFADVASELRDRL